MRLALAAASAALIATSPAETWDYLFSGAQDAPPIELTPDAPKKRFLVKARARGLAPNNRPTTNYVDAQLKGVLSASEVDSDEGSAFVDVRLFEDSMKVRELSAVTAFDLSPNLQFLGDCSSVGATPCEASFEVELERKDAGAGGGRIEVELTLLVEARTEKDQSPNEGPLALPWSIEFVEL